MGDAVLFRQNRKKVLSIPKAVRCKILQTAHKYIWVNTLTKHMPNKDPNRGNMTNTIPSSLLD
jgi:hypothetical protein